MKTHPILMLSLSLLLALGVVGFAEAGNKRPLMQEEEVQEPVVALQAAIECQNYMIDKFSEIMFKLVNLK